MIYIFYLDNNVPSCELILNMVLDRRGDGDWDRGRCSIGEEMGIGIGEGLSGRSFKPYLI